MKPFHRLDMRTVIAAPPGNRVYPARAHAPPPPPETASTPQKSFADWSSVGTLGEIAAPGPGPRIGILVSCGRRADEGALLVEVALGLGPVLM